MFRVCEKCNAKVFETIVDIDHLDCKTRLCWGCYEKKYRSRIGADKEKKEFKKED
jgi:hypothetical protein